MASDNGLHVGPDANATATWAYFVHFNELRRSEISSKR